MDAIRAMAEVDCQALTPTGRNTLIGLCREFIRQTEALEALADALDADQPDFQGFGWTALERLDTLIKAMGSSDRDDKISTLLDLDPFVVVICGLSLSTKKIKRMRNDLWSEILRQAQTAAERLRPLILRNDKVTQLVKDSGNENFRQSQAHGPTTCSSFLLVLQLTKPGYEQSRKDHGSAQGQISHIMMHGLPCYSYTVSYSSKFRTLIDLALHRVVAAYLPTVPADACIRLTTQFDESLLQALIGYLPEFYDSRMFPFLSRGDAKPPQ